MKYIKNIRRLLKQLFSKGYDSTNVNDFPEAIKNNMVYVVGEEKYEWVIVFKCPCGCKEDIQLNLLKEAKPKWSFKVTWKSRITINPSIRRTTGCRSHFDIRDGKVIWW